MKTRAIKYLLPFIIYVSAIRSFHTQGIVVWFPLILAWVIIPLAELFIKPDSKNMGVVEEELAKTDKIYDFILYIIVPLQFIALYFFLKNISDPTLAWCPNS